MSLFFTMQAFKDQLESLLVKHLYFAREGTSKQSLTKWSSCRDGVLGTLLVFLDLRLDAISLYPIAAQGGASQHQSRCVISTSPFSFSWTFRTR